MTRDLVIVGGALARSSLGARRYYASIMGHLDWPGRIITTAPTGRWRRIAELCQRGRSDVVHWSPCHSGPPFLRRHVVTVLDCINIEFVYHDDWRLPLLRWTTRLLLTNAKAVVCISHATRDAVLRNFPIDPARLVVIAGPVDFEHVKPGVRRPATGGDDFILMITNALPHKNTRVALHGLAASSAARRGIALRIVGSADVDAVAACRVAGVAVDLHTNVADAVLAEWLRDCRFFWSPTLAEGLNLPVAEALAVGTDVLASNIDVHREFYAGAVDLYDPATAAATVLALDAAFDRPRGWLTAATARPRPSARDVARQYRQLFDRVARQD